MDENEPLYQVCCFVNVLLLKFLGSQGQLQLACMQKKVPRSQTENEEHSANF
jgi:hypothetical protein